jgi:RHS repeat-associated protein
VGNHYEVKNSVVTKYYFAGATRLAVRTNGTLSYLLGDHIGSSSVTTDANGVKTASALYKAFGETRFSSGNLGTDYKFTGQREEASLGIYYFNARWMDPSLGRFTSPDSIVPTSTQGTQAWDRYGFVNNNPVRYNDPTGHCIFGCTFSFSWNLSATVNAGLNSIGINGGDAIKFLDTTSKVLDIVNLAIDVVAAVGDVVSAAAGSLLGLGLFEANPIVKGAETVGNALSTISLVATEWSDVISGETNSTGSLNVSDEGIDFNLDVNLGRDTYTSGLTTATGWLSPIGAIGVFPAAAAALNDFGLLYIGSLSNVPKSIPVIDINEDCNYSGTCDEP